ncbi:MAG: hypothetical protein WCL51_07990 [Bacteroidota bacterium]
MKKNFSFIVAAIVATIGITSCAPEMYQSMLQTTAFTEKIDSSSMETQRFYDPKSKLQYAVTNDNQNLYIVIKATEEQTQYKIIRAGMQLTIGNVSKTNPIANMQYPLALGFQKPTSKGTERKSGSAPQRPDISSLKLQFKSKYQEMHLTGFKPEVGAVLATHNAFGITVNMDWDTLNTLYYKAIIPFKTFYKEKLDLSDTTKYFNMTFTVNGIEMPTKEGNKEMGQGAPEPGMSGRNGMGGGGRMGGGGMSGMGGSRMGGAYGGQSHNDMTEANKVKFRLQLVVKKN